MAIEKEILNRLHTLPLDKQREVLDFVEFLAVRSETARLDGGWLPGFWERVPGSWEGELQRPPQGELEIRDELV